MKTERILRRFAIACAVVLLFAAATPRTSWIAPSGSGMTHSAGWDWIATLSGVLALAGLGVGAAARPRIALAVFGASIAAGAFGLAMFAAASHWAALMTGAMTLPGWILYPAPLVPAFAVVAAAGMVCTLILLGVWLQPSRCA
ncbi:MAG: hypothetical protein IT338_00655 [Thermomicrobiales bacterium]|nr:hypothetical protein [Thermomicrobiales bacterium]